MCKICSDGYSLTRNDRECVKTEQENCAEIDSETGECIGCKQGILIDSRGRCNLKNICTIEGCQTCELDYNDELKCVLCNRSYVLYSSNGLCVKERNTKQEKNCKRLSMKNTCIDCDYGYYLTQDGCIEDQEKELFSPFNPEDSSIIQLF